MADEEPAPCLIVVGIVMVVFDIIVIESTVLTYVGGFMVFLGIVIAIFTEQLKQKSASARATRSQQNQQVVQTPPQYQPQISPQNVEITPPPPQLHRFCPYCGTSTNLEICPDCGEKID